MNALILCYCIFLKLVTILVLSHFQIIYKELLIRFFLHLRARLSSSCFFPPSVAEISHLPISLRFSPTPPQSFHQQCRCSICLCVPAQERQDIGRCCRCLTFKRGPTAVEFAKCKKACNWCHILSYSRKWRDLMCLEEGLVEEDILIDSWWKRGWLMWVE